MNLAVVSSVFSNYQLEHVLPIVARAGYEGIDLWGGRPHVFRSDLGPSRLKALRRQAADLGLEIVSVMPAFYRYPFSLTTSDERIRRDSLDYMKESIDNAVQLGAETVLTVPGRSLHGQTTGGCLGSHVRQPFHHCGNGGGCRIAHRLGSSQPLCERPRGQRG